MDHNSQNYSAIKTPIPAGSKLPQIVVQMPVYKESLEEVGAHLFISPAVLLLAEKPCSVLTSNAKLAVCLVVSRKPLWLSSELWEPQRVLPVEAIELWGCPLQLLKPFAEFHRG